MICLLFVPNERKNTNFFYAIILPGALLGYLAVLEKLLGESLEGGI